MTFSEFRVLLSCSYRLLWSVVTANRALLDETAAKVERIHAQIDSRKQKSNE